MHLIVGASLVLIGVLVFLLGDRVLGESAGSLGELFSMPKSGVAVTKSIFSLLIIFLGIAVLTQGVAI